MARTTTKYLFTDDKGGLIQSRDFEWDGENERRQPAKQALAHRVLLMKKQKRQVIVWVMIGEQDAVPFLGK